jgi:hypothetical protein
MLIAKIEQGMKKNKSNFGEWFFSNPRIVRIRLLESFENEGIKSATVRNWCSREVLPQRTSWKTIEKVTRRKISQLFPS